MDTPLPSDSGPAQAGVDLEYRYHSAVRTGKAGRRRKAPRATKRPVGQALVRLIRHCFPWFWEALEALEDPREDPRYSPGQVVCTALLMFACRLPSLRALDRVTDDRRFWANWCTLSRAQTPAVICSRQMTNVLGVLDPDELGALRPRMVKALVRAKRLPDAYLLGHLMVASDGTGVFSSGEYHCPRCLTQRHADGSMTYLHNVLEAKVVTRGGLALSVLSEPLVNPQDGGYDKQDCESKAFHRLLPRLKQAFARQPLVHLLDSLYCNGPVFQAVEARGHRFVANFKPGSIPTVYAEALELLKLEPHNRLTQTLGSPAHRVTREYAWVGGLEYQGLTLCFLMCRETRDGKTTTFAWLTDLPLERDTVIEVADAGRLRWTIENEGFNEQKTGYELEHFCDCQSYDVMLALYLVLQIAHALMQLLAKSDLLDPVPTLTFLAALLLEALRNQPLPEALFAPDLSPFQIHFARGPT